MKALLEQVRLARSGTLPLAPVPEPVRSYLGHGLGRICDVLGVWFEADSTDRRACDAAIRYYGLGRMPELLTSIATSFPKRGERRGVTTRRLQQLIDEVIAQVDVRPFPLKVKPMGLDPKKPEDPFPIPVDRRTRIAMSRTLLWAWADVTETMGKDAEAILLYEYEHGLRTWSPTITHPQAKARAQRRAWSMLDVAMYRMIEAIPSDPVVDRILGPRQFVTLEPSHIDEWDTVLAFNQWPQLGEPHAALDCVRDALATYRPESIDMLGLVRDGLLRLRHTPEDVTARALALTVIASRQRRTPAGIVAADQLLDHLGEVVRHRSIGPDARSRVAVVLTSTLRAAQEAAELSDQLGDMATARRLFSAAHHLLLEFGDPQEEVEPGGWLQQLLLAEANWLRTRARLTRDPTRSLRRAESAATRSSELVFKTGELPIPWGLAAEEQRIGVILDRAEYELSASGRTANPRRVAQANTLICQQEAHWLTISAERTRPEELGQVRIGLLRSAFSAWRVALIEGDKDNVGSSRDLAWERMGPWTPPTLVAQFRNLDSTSQRKGLVPLIGSGELEEVSRLQDDGGQRTMRLEGPSHLQKIESGWLR
jgi:hypothetical protein